MFSGTRFPRVHDCLTRSVRGTCSPTGVARRAVRRDSQGRSDSGRPRVPPARRRHFGQKVRRPRRHQRYKKDREKEKKKERKKENGLTDIDGAVDVVDESKEKVVSAQYAIFVVGAGGFGGKRVSEHLVPTVETPKRAPDASLQFQTSIDQVPPPPSVSPSILF